MDRPQRENLRAFFGHLGMIAGRPKMESVMQSVMNVTEKAEVLIAFFCLSFYRQTLLPDFHIRSWHEQQRRGAPKVAELMV